MRYRVFSAGEKEPCSERSTYIERTKAARAERRPCFLAAEIELVGLRGMSFEILRGCTRKTLRRAKMPGGGSVGGEHVVIGRHN
jgi:hypothetical protein